MHKAVSIYTRWSWLTGSSQEACQLVTQALPEYHGSLILARVGSFSASNIKLILGLF